MRWIDRGAAPNRVAVYNRQYTQGWVRYFRDRVGAIPGDSCWREFRDGLGERSGGMCWYCERLCASASPVVSRAATLDHFKPRSKFPQLTYEWSNWVFSCYACNAEFKEDRWPQNGYVDPAAADIQNRPESYFDYDSKTNDVIPRHGLSDGEHKRAQDTIDDLSLNRLEVKINRANLIQDLFEFFEDDLVALSEFIETQPIEFLGSARMALAQLRNAGEIPDNA